MKPTDTVRLVGYVSQVWPSMRINEFTADAWEPIFTDVDLADALNAVTHLAKTRAGYISPADIRRQIAAAYRLLPTSEAAGLVAASAVAGQQGTGSRKLDPVTYAAYRAMGGPGAFTAPAGVVRAQWARVWADCVRDTEDSILGGDLGALVADKRRAALAAAPAAAAIEPPPPAVPTTDRRAEIAAGIRAMIPAGSPELLRTRENWWQRHRRVKREAVPNPHFTGYPQPALTESEQS